MNEPYDAPAEVCQCCHADDASEYDIHLGEVCEECGELLEEIGWDLVEDETLALCHPPPIDDSETWHPFNE
ncbi:hypothetical protein BH09VER1_BH09VER1_44180 [soil metagenome]